MLKKRLKLPRIRLPRASTLMFVPHSQQSTYSVRIPFGAAALLLLLVVLAMMLIIYSSVRYLHMKENMHELFALRSVNQLQDRQLRQMEAEVHDLRGKMYQLEFLEQDVRAMLDSEVFSGRVIDRRENPHPSRGGGRETSAATLSDKPLLGFPGRDQSFDERKAEWNRTYLETRNITTDTLSGVDLMWENLDQLKNDVNVVKDYLEARPSGSPTMGEISSTFGTRRSPFSGRTELHPAVDIAADHGTAVLATGKGVVVFAGYQAGYGRTLEIDHGYGFRTVYSHNSSLIVKTGQQVARGDLIARVGSSGASTGPHLHYEVILNGVRVDPEPYILETEKAPGDGRDAYVQ